MDSVGAPCLAAGGIAARVCDGPDAADDFADDDDVEEDARGVRDALSRVLVPDAPARIVDTARIVVFIARASPTRLSASLRRPQLRRALSRPRLGRAPSRAPGAPGPPDPCP